MAHIETIDASVMIGSRVSPVTVAPPRIADDVSAFVIALYGT